jgi:hypothetical protein
MNSTFYRDNRRQRLANALAILAALPELTAEQLELAAWLEREQAALAADEWRVTDRTYLAVAADWAWQNFTTIKALVDHDPVTVAAGIPSALTAAHGLAILNASLPHAPAGPPANYLERVRAACEADLDETAFTELVHTAHSFWLSTGGEEPVYPFDDVGVLLPLRLETLFDAPGSRHNDSPDQWQLSLRVTPDEASICRDNTHVSEGEARVLTAFWQVVKQLGDLHESWLDGDDAALAWQQLADRVTPARAAWLVSAIAPQFDGDTVTLAFPPDMPGALQPNRVGGMPPELRVFAVTNTVIDGRTHHPLGRLPMAADKQIDQAALTLPLPGKLRADPDEPEDSQRWWASWETAKAVGLGGEWLLPVGMTPQNITALYVVGIGDETPDAHFKAQVDAGELSVLHLGAPTNTVRGASAASLGQNGADWRQVAQARLQQRLNPQQPLPSGVGWAIQQHLTGAPGSLPFFHGANWVDETTRSHRLVQALWPALWGHWLADLWQTGDDAHRAGWWACQHLYPEGPLMPLRIGDQPYGLLPVTALTQWQTDARPDAEGTAQRRVELAMARELSDLRSRWAAAARGEISANSNDPSKRFPKRIVVGKSTEQFMDLLGQDALSQRYIARKFAPAWAHVPPYRLTQSQQEKFDDHVLRAYGAASDRLGRQPDTPYLANGSWLRSTLPLVRPWRLTYRLGGHHEKEPFDLVEVLTMLYQGMELETLFMEFRLRVLPNSLLIRLLIYSTQLAALWRRNPMAPALLSVAQVQEDGAIGLGKELDHWRQAVEDEETGEIERYVLNMPADRQSQLERALRATLDSAAHRIDPWIIGFAWQRLKQHSSSARRTHRLGAYGWVDGPFDGQPGPTDAGRLHTPSYNQTLAALILRDKFLSSGRARSVNDSGRNPWEMNITANRARLAEEIADEVRLGFHIYEIVGRYVENILGSERDVNGRSGHQTVKELRISDLYAMRSERKDPHEVCNGIEALRGLLARDVDGNFVGDPNFPLSDQQRERLELLYAALDTYGDLLMADGVLQLVNRQVDRAAETMDAAAGFSRPPSFEFIRTPPSGYQLESLVVSALPFVAVDDLPADASPLRLADPSVAAFIDGKLAGGWVWQAINDDGRGVLGTVDLATLGLAPIDTLVFADDFLREWARRSLGLPLVFVDEARNRAWRAKDAQDNPLGTATLVDLSLTPEALSALHNAALYSLLRAAVGAAEDAIITEIVPSDPRGWEVRDRDGALLGAVTVVDLNLTPEALSALHDAALHDRVRASVGAAGDANVEEIVPNDPRLWVVRDENGGLLGLADPNRLGLTPAEVDALKPDDLQRRVRQAVGFPQVRIDPPRQHQMAQQLTAALGNRPAAGRDLADAAVDDDVRAELAGRYNRLRAACQGVIDELLFAADDSQRAAAIRRASLWGVTPVSEAPTREAFYAVLTRRAAPEDAASPAAVAALMAETLTQRLDRDALQQTIDGLRNAADDAQRASAIQRALAWGIAPTAAPEDGAPLAVVAEQAAVALEARLNTVRAAPDSIPALTQALAALAAPQGKLAILGCWSQATLRKVTRVKVNAPEAALDEQWLTVVAATRASLARLEALQLELDLPLEAWSSSPGDPWQQVRIQKNRKARDEGPEAEEPEPGEPDMDELPLSPLGLRTPRFVAAYGSAETWAGPQVAVGLIDAFSEAIPMPQRSTMTAFGFNAPAARAPQAILLAVPPRPRQRLDSELLLQIVAETRELAHARAARIEDLGDLQALTPTMWLLASGPTRMRLESWPLFE